MPLTEAEKQALEAARARKSGQGFGNAQRPQPEQPADQGGAIVPAARVETAKSLGIALKQSVGEFAALAGEFSEASDQAADQVSDWLTSALSGEDFAHRVLGKTAQKLQERQALTVDAPPAFDAPKATGLELFNAHFGRTLGGSAPKQIGG